MQKRKTRMSHRTVQQHRYCTVSRMKMEMLFGSIHVGREDYYPLPKYVLDAFEDADSLAVELDLLAVEKDMKLQMKALSQLVYYDGSKIQDHIPQDLYEESVAILDSYGINMKALESYCPAFWASMIESLMMSELGGDVNLGIG